MSKATEAVVRRFYEEGVNNRDATALDATVTPDFAMHSPLLGELRGAAAYKEAALGFLTASPDFKATVQDIVATDDKAAARILYKGTDTAGLAGEPTNKAFTLTATYVFRLANGKLAEAWQEVDRLGMLQQLGAIPQPGASS